MSRRVSNNSTSVIKSDDADDERILKSLRTIETQSKATLLYYMLRNFNGVLFALVYVHIGSERILIGVYTNNY